MQLVFHPQPFLLEGLALHVIADPLQQLVDRRQVLLGRLLAVARRFDRRVGAGLVDGFAAQVPNPRPGKPADHEGATANQQQGHGPRQPVGQQGL